MSTHCRTIFESDGSFGKPGFPRRSGFTLVELLLAMATTGLVLVASYMALFSGMESYRRSVSESEVLTVLTRSMDRIFTDLAGAYTARHGTEFVIVDETEENEIFGDVPVDRIRFQAHLLKVNWADVPQSDQTEVEYYIDTDEETPQRWLVRRTDSPADENLSEGGEIHLVGPRVIGMNVEAHDGSKWVSEWDSPTKLPLAVRIRLYMAPSIPLEDPAKLETLSSTIWLPSSVGQATAGAIISEETEETSSETEAESEESPNEQESLVEESPTE